MYSLKNKKQQKNITNNDLVNVNKGNSITLHTFKHRLLETGVFQSANDFICMRFVNGLNVT